MSTEALEKVNIFDWVEKAKADPIKYFERQATEVVLTAIGMAEPFSDHIFLKGGILMGVLYGSPRNTGDIDFTTDLDPVEELPDALRSALNGTLPRAAAEIGYSAMVLKVQTVKIRPRKNSLAKDTFPALELTIGYANRGSKQEKSLNDGKSTLVVHVDISFNEPVSGLQIVKLDESLTTEIKAYSIYDLIAEKLRALLQQPEKRKNRRQDIYDISLLLEAFPFDPEEKKDILSSLIKKCSSRGIEPDQNSLSSNEVRERAAAEWETLAIEIGQEELPDFDSCFARVEEHYKSLPWK